MIRLVEVEVRGQSAAGAFRGSLVFPPGLQVISGPNAFGKSLAARTVAWCLGLEPMLGFQDNDSSRLPLAAREEAVFTTGPTQILGSECAITFQAADGRRLGLSRDIKGDTSVVRVVETDAEGNTRHSVLQARGRSMKDEHGGLQRFLFEWLHWARVEVATYHGTVVDVYLENLVPLFYIEQDEGWTDLQSRQMARYGQLQIAQIAVEYLLGALGTVRNRFARQQAIQRRAALRERARTIAERATALFARNGWNVPWSANGSIDEIIARWSVRTLQDALQHKAEVDLNTQRAGLVKSVESLRRTLTTETIDPANVSAHTAASQQVIDLKRRRHELNDEMRTLRVQAQEADDLLQSLDHRIQSASDLLRLKTSGVGRMDEVECPTCHRNVDPATFLLSTQAESEIGEHIKALRRDRQLINKNVVSLEARLSAIRSEGARLEADFRDAERTLATVTAAVGTVREQLAQTAAKLSATERELDRLDDTVVELVEVQDGVTKWINEARELQEPEVADADLEHRLRAFTRALRQYLLALGHSAVTADTCGEIRLDDQYVVYLGQRQLKSLGSASDRSRLVAAFSLALAAASDEVGGLHPGVVILDEPLQQNPDVRHRDLFSKFLSEELAQHATFQIIVLTSLSEAELANLGQLGAVVRSVEGRFLKLEAPLPAGRAEVTEGLSPPAPDALPGEAGVGPPVEGAKQADERDVRRGEGEDESGSAPVEGGGLR